MIRFSSLLAAVLLVFFILSAGAEAQTATFVTLTPTAASANGTQPDPKSPR